MGPSCRSRGECGVSTGGGEGRRVAPAAFVVRRLVDESAGWGVAGVWREVLRVVGGRGGRGWRCRPAGCREWQHGEPGEGFGELAGPGPGFSDAEVEATKDRL